MGSTVSIVIPVYNMASFVKEAVQSALADPYPHKEIIVVDDGSRDESASIAASCGPGVRVIRQDNQGAACALNNGFAVASGEYLCWLSADDLFIPGKLEAQVRSLESMPGAVASHTDAEVINGAGAHLSCSVGSSYLGATSLYRLLLGNDINGSTIMVRRSIFEAMGRFDSSLRADVDGAMWFKLLANGHGIVRTPGVFGKYRWHDGNQSHDHELMNKSKDTVRLAVLRQHWPQVQWWQQDDIRWWRALSDALTFDHCHASAEFVKNKFRETEKGKDIPSLPPDGTLVGGLFRRLAFWRIKNARRAALSNERLAALQ